MLRDMPVQLATPKVQAQFPLRSDRTVEMQAIPLYELDATAGLAALFDEHTRQLSKHYLSEWTVRQPISAI